MEKSETKKSVWGKVLLFGFLGLLCLYLLHPVLTDVYVGGINLFYKDTIQRSEAKMDQLSQQLQDWRAEVKITLGNNFWWDGGRGVMFWQVENPVNSFNGKGMPPFPVFTVWCTGCSKKIDWDEKAWQADGHRVVEYLGFTPSCQSCEKIKALLAKGEAIKLEMEKPEGPMRNIEKMQRFVRDLPHPWNWLRPHWYHLRMMIGW